MNVFMFGTFFMLAIISCEAQNAHHEWNYDSKGPDVWPHEFKNCAGQKQSPINIDTSQLEYDSNLKPFVLNNYDKDLSWNVSHNGHTVVISKISPDEVSISGSDFDESYNLLQFHFHWGFNNYQGSEHYIDNKKFPLEMHMVHKSNENNLTVLGFLFRLSEHDNPNLANLLKAVSGAKNKDNYQTTKLSLNSLLPANHSELERYYRYIGSLTTPPCSEDIIWNVFEQRINISHAQLQNFRKNILRSNFREPQNSFDREVFSSFPVAKNTLRKSKEKEQCVISGVSASVFSPQNGHLMLALIILLTILL